MKYAELEALTSMNLAKNQDRFTKFGMRSIVCSYRINCFGGSDLGLFGFLQETKIQDIFIKKPANEDERTISVDSYMSMNNGVH